MRIPSLESPLLKQANRSNFLSDLWSTYGIDLMSNLGRIRVGERLKLNTNDTDQANLGVPVSFQAFDGLMWSMAGARIFKNTTPTGTRPTLLTAFAEDASSGVVTTYTSLCDMIVFNRTLLTSAPTTAYSKDGDGAGTGAWTDRSMSLTTGTIHKWAFLKSHNRAYVTDNNHNIKSIDTSWSVAAPGSDYAIDLGNFTDVGFISTIEASSDTIWIGTIRYYVNGSTSMLKASVFEWDGISSAPTREYKINALGVYAIEIIDQIPYVLDSNGVWSKFNGSGFTEIARLPLKKNQFLGIPSSSTPTDRFVNPNGTAFTPDGTLLAFVGNLNAHLKTTTGGTINENLPSGIWEASEEMGMVHRHPISLDRLTSAVNTDYGQNRLLAIGAMGDAKIGSDEALPISSWIVGCSYYTSATATKTGIFVQSPSPTDNATYAEGQKQGYFVTQWLESQGTTGSNGIADTWERIFATFKKFASSLDRVFIKYRDSEEEATTIDITWVNASSFTTTTNVTGKEGYEVEITSGIGGGFLPNIRTITNNGGTYTVVLDESFTGATGTARARLQNWKKIGTFSKTTEITGNYGKADLKLTRTAIQVKCVLRFTGDEELHALFVVNKANLKAE